MRKQEMSVLCLAQLQHGVTHVAGVCIRGACGELGDACMGCRIGAPTPSGWHVCTTVRKEKSRGRLWLKIHGFMAASNLLVLCCQRISHVLVRAWLQSADGLVDVHRR
jgi:hypothetical protein